MAALGARAPLRALTVAACRVAPAALQCPTLASTQAECIPPETQITKGLKDRTKKKRATFEFSSNEAGTSFECSLDGGAFTPCSSPHTLKVKKGKHRFEVRGQDAAGNVKGSPAADSWKVRKRKHRP